MTTLQSRIGMPQPTKDVVVIRASQVRGLLIHRLFELVYQVQVGAGTRASQILQGLLEILACQSQF